MNMKLTQDLPHSEIKQVRKELKENKTSGLYL